MDDGKLIEGLRTLEEDQGPFVSLYLNTEAAREDGPKEVRLRWRSLRGEVEGEAPEKALLLLDDLVGDAHRRGRGLAAFTSGEEIAFRRSLGAPVGNGISVGPLFHLIPLLEWNQDHPLYAVVVADRTGAVIHVVGGLHKEEIFDVEGDHDEFRKVNPGGWSQPRFQNRAEDSWERNAEQVAEALDKIVREEALRMVIVMGDVRALSFLKEHLSLPVASLLYELDTAPPTEGDLESIRPEIEEAVSALAARTTEEIVEKFVEERGQRDLAVEGVDQTLSALRMGQVQTLLLQRDDLGGAAWFARSDLTQVAAGNEALTSIGIEDVEEGALMDVLVRGALGTGAETRVVPREQAPSEGVGGILRFAAETSPEA